METQEQTRLVAEPLGELSHQQRFFNFFQHEITGTLRPSALPKKLWLTKETVRQLSKMKWTVLQKLPS